MFAGIWWWWWLYQDLSTLHRESEKAKRIIDLEQQMMCNEWYKDRWNDSSISLKDEWSNDQCSPRGYTFWLYKQNREELWSIVIDSIAIITIHVFHWHSECFGAQPIITNVVPMVRKAYEQYKPIRIAQESLVIHMVCFSCHVKLKCLENEMYVYICCVLQPSCLTAIAKELS